MEIATDLIESAKHDLRDKFAMAALTGLLSDSKVRATPDEFANVSYEIADAMMKAREG